MMGMHWLRWATLTALLWLGGCHADSEDPAGQAKEMADPVRREFALGNLQRIHSTLLGKAQGKREEPTLVAFREATQALLTKLYIDHPEDSQNGLRVLSLLQEMREPRALPALLKGLEWQAEVTEEHAISAALTLQLIPLPEDKRGEAIADLSKALERVTGKRGVDNRMRKGFIEALGVIGDKRAVPALSAVMLAQSDAQNFLFNNLAVMQLAKIADPETVPGLIKALYLCDPNSPAMRINKAFADKPAKVSLALLTRDEKR